MSSATLLDTRSPYQGQSTQALTDADSSQAGSPDFAFFSRAVQKLVHSSHRDRPACRKNVVERLRDSLDKTFDTNVLIGECVLNGGSEGLDIGIDVLSQFGEWTSQYAFELCKKDGKRWVEQKGVTPAAHHFNDDVWYILLRAAAQSDLEPRQKLNMLFYCARMGTESIREAGIRAIGDMRGPHATEQLRRLEKGECSPSVRQAIAEMLDDLEG